MITSLYASIITIWLIIISFRVIALRGNPVFKFFKFQDDNENSLERAIRGHSNLIEYSPIFLILLYFSELAKFNDFYLHLIGSLFVLGRLMHGYCFAFLKYNMFLRVGGTVLAISCLSTLSLRLLVNFFN